MRVARTVSLGVFGVPYRGAKVVCDANSLQAPLTIIIRNHSAIAGLLECAPQKFRETIKIIPYSDLDKSVAYSTKAILFSGVDNFTPDLRDPPRRYLQRVTITVPVARIFNDPERTPARLEQLRLL